MTYKRDKGDIEMNTSEAIKAKRKNLGLTQKDFADALGMGRNGDSGSLTLCLPLDFHNPLHYSPLRLIFLSNFKILLVIVCHCVV